jgi:hypothetical protein
LLACEEEEIILLSPVCLDVLHTVMVTAPSNAAANAEPALFCTVCSKPSEMLCTKCKQRPYCCKGCQKSDWAHHKLYCVKAPTAKSVKRNSKVWLSFFARQQEERAGTNPKNTESKLRFKVGDHVICQLAHHDTEWGMGIVIGLWYTDNDGTYPYVVQLINGLYFTAPEDNKDCITHNTEAEWTRVNSSVSASQCYYCGSTRRKLLLLGDKGCKHTPKCQNLACRQCRRRYG